MTHSNAAEYLPLVKALAEGKTIQYRSFEGTEWVDMEDPVFSSTVERYRIKPTPKTVPWEPKDVPLNAVLRTKHVGDPYWWTILAVLKDGIVTSGATDIFCKPYQFYCDACEHSVDGGKTWLPCSREITA